MNFLNKIELIFSNPKRFFSKVKNETMGPVLVFFLYFTLITNIFSVIYYSKTYSFPAILSPLVYIGLLAFIFLTIFINGGITHLSCKLFSGKGTFTSTLRSFIYGGLPGLILGLISGILSLILGEISYMIISILLMLVGLVYSIYLEIVGLKMYHHISTGKALLSALAPLIVIFILVIFFIGLILMGVLIGGLA